MNSIYEQLHRENILQSVDGEALYDEVTQKVDALYESAQDVTETSRNLDQVVTAGASMEHYIRTALSISPTQEWDRKMLAHYRVGLNRIAQANGLDLSHVGYSTEAEDKEGPAKSGQSMVKRVFETVKAFFKKLIELFKKHVLRIGDVHTTLTKEHDWLQAKILDGNTKFKEGEIKEPKYLNLRMGDQTLDPAKALGVSNGKITAYAGAYVMDLTSMEFSKVRDLKKYDLNGELFQANWESKLQKLPNPYVFPGGMEITVENLSELTKSVTIEQIFNGKKVGKSIDVNISKSTRRVAEVRYMLAREGKDVLKQIEEAIKAIQHLGTASEDCIKVFEKMFSNLVQEEGKVYREWDEKTANGSRKDTNVINGLRSKMATDSARVIGELTALAVRNTKDTIDWVKASIQ